MKFFKQCAVWLVLVLILTGCASMRSVRTQGLDRTPHYRGRVDGDYLPLGFFPVSIQPGMNDWFQSDRREALRPLLDRMNACLEQMDFTVSMQTDGYPERSGPEITVGLEEAGSKKEEPRLMLRELGPTKAWVQAFTEKTPETGVKGVLWISVGIQDYLVRQKDWKGGKVLDLGTGHSIPVPWLTSLDTPVEVLQVSGALISPEGKILRSGAEGIIAKRTGFLASVFDLRSKISQSDIQTLINETVREDLPGSPPAWEAALNNLLAQLTGRPDRLMLPEKQ
ncbi:MAG TPA: hypothetical protein ENN03_01795 [bacterium]|nr:hypothetical protein [bacterium]